MHMQKVMWRGGVLLWLSFLQLGAAKILDLKSSEIFLSLTNGILVPHDFSHVIHAKCFGLRTVASKSLGFSPSMLLILSKHYDATRLNSFTINQ